MLLKRFALFDNLRKIEESSGFAILRPWPLAPARSTMLQAPQRKNP
jgi:hypothetical protein